MSETNKLALCAVIMLTGWTVTIIATVLAGMLIETAIPFVMIAGFSLSFICYFVARVRLDV